VAFGKGVVRCGEDDAGVAPRFIGCGPEQALMPPSLLDWVPEEQLVLTILEAVEEMELGAFLGHVWTSDALVRVNVRQCWLGDVEREEVAVKGRLRGAGARAAAC
jgi:hypothetical protein